MLLAELVSTLEAVAATPARNAKIAALAGLIARLAPDEIAPAAGFVAGEPRQGKIGVGWASVYRTNAVHATEPSVTIGELDRALDALQATTGPGSASERTRLLSELLGRMTAPEADFARRVLVGELRQGALAGVVSEAIAKAAGVPGDAVRRGIMLSGSLGRAAEAALTRGLEGLGDIGLEVLRPVEPMLASTAASLADALSATGLASVEWKLDGVRIQVHREGDDVRVYTRNLNDATERVPEIVAIVRELPVRSAVLDGEAIAMDEQSRPHVFQDVMSRFGRQTGAQLEMVPWFFDVLHVDGEDLIDRPLRERADVLARVAGAWRMPGIVTDDASAAEEVLAAALDAGHEGVMVKAIDSTYLAGRRGKSWLKVKPARTLDLVVLGAEWGHGRRKGWLSNLHLGARGPDGTFVMVGKTFKGLTDDLLRWQTERLLELERARSGIFVEAHPELVVEIALDGVQASTRYPGGVALRFARVKGYRADKDAADADTIETVQGMLKR